MSLKDVLSAEAFKIFESVPDLYLILSPGLKILTASDAYLAATLSERENITGKYFFDAFPENPDSPYGNSVKKLETSLRMVLETRKPHQMSLQRYKVAEPAAAVGGFKEKYLRPVNTPVLNEQGQVLYIIHKMGDVTEQVNQQQHIEEPAEPENSTDWEQEKLKAIYMQAPVAIGIYGGRNHKIELINPRMSDLLGRPVTELLGKSLFEALPETKGMGFEEIISEVFVTGKPYEGVEVPFRLKRNGQLVSVYCNIIYQPLRNASQQITAVIQVCTDVTEQVLARLKTEEGERQLRMITDSLPVLIGYLDREARYRFANKAYEEWFHVKAKELPGRRVQEVVGEKAYNGVKKYIERALSGERVNFDAKMPYREDFTKYVRISYVPDIQEGRVAGFYSLVTDITAQTGAMQQLKESEEKYRSLFETMEQGFCILEMIFDEENKPHDYRFLETNPRFEQQTGLKNAKGKTALELVPNLESHWFEIYGKVALTGETIQTTQESKALGRWFEINAFRPGGNGSRKVALLFSDISKRREAEESLKRSNHWFSLLNKATQDAIWDWDLITQEISWNEEIRHMFNYKAEEIETAETWWYSHIHPEDRDRTVSSIHSAIDSGKEHWAGEYRFRTGSGGYKIVYDRGYVIHDENGKPVRMIGSMQDITERKQAEEASKESEARLLRIIEGSNDGIWDWDFRNDAAWWNKRLDEILGIEIAEDQRSLRAVAKYIHPDDQNLVPDALKAHLENGKKFEVEYRIIRPSGEIRYLLCKGKAILDKEGNARLMSGTLADVTDRRKAAESLKSKNEQLTRINNDLDNFIYTASHDLKAPILNIEGLVNLLRKYSGNDAKNNQRLNSIMGMISASVDRFKETIKDLAEVAKVQTNAEEEVVEILFEDMLEEVRLNIQTLIDESGATIETDFTQIPSITYSRKNLRSIMYNLVSNAIKYRSPQRPPHIHITTMSPGYGRILLEVQDNGLGIKEKDKPKVFMMFKRLHQHVEGTGIGMAIVKKIIDNSGGKIELESEEGKGSVFKVEFRA